MKKRVLILSTSPRQGSNFLLLGPSYSLITGTGAPRLLPGKLALPGQHGKRKCGCSAGARCVNLQKIEQTNAVKLKHMIYKMKNWEPVAITGGTRCFSTEY